MCSWNLVSKTRLIYIISLYTCLLQKFVSEKLVLECILCISDDLFWKYYFEISVVKNLFWKFWKTVFEDVWKSLLQRIKYHFKIYGGAEITITMFKKTMTIEIRVLAHVGMILTFKTMVQWKKKLVRIG